MAVEISEERLSELLAYCRLGPEEAADEQTIATIKSLYAAAVGYREEAGIKEPKEGTSRKAQYDLLVNALVLDGYDRRGTHMEATAITENPVFRRMLTQLKLTEGLVSNPDTTTS